MNEIRRHDRDAEEIARIREIVGRQKLPEFVTGFDVNLGEHEGEPAMWIAFERTGDEGLDIAELRQRSKRMLALYDEVQSDILREFDSRYPYFRSRSVDVASRDG